ncbi:biotin carboxylase N-terminal domain-containing protein [Piscinibacter sp. XHJ-5]|uniref:acetyl/propionyl/methylcrotonyl-CoA carboxylase subunit alpha n=1 Tax=Piscinibacter sp. XHJ-5 TaxID=3037797 RepID=UPI0024536CB1|nr:biotin carboxylase N-terminal domain-containing protein [Piscinibacter sp. XHJ-5]
MKRLLVANRGEIACRVMRTARAMGLATVAVHSRADAGALHVQEADAACALGGDSPADSYLRIEALIAAARATGADAVHPGYGFLSESAEFAQAVVDAGLTWIGPPPAAIRQLGSKSAIKALAATLDIPCLPGYAGADQSAARFVQEAGRIGYPVMVKAAAGGGGRGMRLVQQPSDLPAALQSARSEAEAAFGSGELLLERALAAPRHVEVQVFADAHGHCIHMGERDCSVQRRHQKLIEESPSPGVDAALRERMGACAVRLARSAGYIGAGTVEFLLVAPAAHGEAEFFLMEMNTRLQVEHPVTEALAGVDLVEWQLRIARGESLPMAQSDLRLQGHAIEVRLCAEDETFSPHAGRVQRFIAPRGVRVDHALHDGALVPPFYDSMLGKLIAHAPTREQAIDRLIGALDAGCVLGLPSNRALLAACLRDPVFRAGEARIPFLAERGDALRRSLAERESALLPLLVAGVWQAQAATSPSRTLASPFDRPMRLRHRDQTIDARVQERSPDTLRIAIGDTAVFVRCTSTQLALDGVAHALRAAQLSPSEWHLQIGAVDAFVADASFEPEARDARHAAPEIKAPFSGRIVGVHAAPAQQVAAGDTLIVIESMKLEHAVNAPRAATVSRVAVQVGQQVAPQQLLVTLEGA